jgi:NitT/TauT family transport system substrate-binding protein
MATQALASTARVTNAPAFDAGLDEEELGRARIRRYSTIGHRATQDPATVQTFVDTMLDALKIATANKSVVEAAAHKAFPIMSDRAIKGALDRTYADNIWSKDGFISEKGYALDMSIVAKSGEFSKTITYADVIDMSFVKKHKA